MSFLFRGCRTFWGMMFRGVIWWGLSFFLLALALHVPKGLGVFLVNWVAWIPLFVAGCFIAGATYLLGVRLVWLVKGK